MSTKKKTTFGISFPDERILEMAKARSKERGMSLSAYINQLIRKDLSLPGAFTAYDLPSNAEVLAARLEKAKNEPGNMGEQFEYLPTKTAIKSEPMSTAYRDA